jgi:hypothetical protein
MTHEMPAPEALGFRGDRERVHHGKVYCIRGAIKNGGKPVRLPPTSSKARALARGNPDGLSACLAVPETELPRGLPRHYAPENDEQEGFAPENGEMGKFSLPVPPLLIAPCTSMEVVTGASKA